MPEATQKDQLRNIAGNTPCCADNLLGLAALVPWLLLIPAGERPGHISCGLCSSGWRHHRLAILLVQRRQGGCNQNSVRQLFQTYRNGSNLIL